LWFAWLDSKWEMERGMKHSDCETVGKSTDLPKTPHTSRAFCAGLTFAVAIIQAGNQSPYESQVEHFLLKVQEALLDGLGIPEPQNHRDSHYWQDVLLPILDKVK
jgi:hypothetical protein